MKSLIIYFFLEWKKSLRLAKKMIISVCLMMILLTVGVTAATYIMTKANILSKVQVAILVPTTEDQTRMALQFASTLDSIQSICEFVYYDEPDRVMEDLRAGNVQACFVFPDHFYEDVDSGRNTPATVYVSDDPDLSQQLFFGMLKNSVSLLQTAESGVYAVLDLSEQYPTELGREKIGDLMLDLYLEQLFNAGRFFEDTVISPFDTYSLQEYIFGGLLLLCVFLPGLCFGFFYSPGQRSLEQKLQIMNIRAWKLSFVRVIVMGQLLWLNCLIVYVIGCVFSIHSKYTIVYWNYEIVLGALFLCMAAACLFHGIYACSGDVRTGTVAVLMLELWMFFGSGMMIPLDFLPEVLQDVCRMTHFDAWSNYLLALLYQGFDRKSACIIGLYTVGMFSVGVFGLWKHTLSGYRYS